MLSDWHLLSKLGRVENAEMPGHTHTIAAHDLLEEYERRMARAMASMPERKPWEKTDRKEIVTVAKKCLGIWDAWVPEIQAETVRVSEHGEFVIERLQFSSWPGVMGAAHLYVPQKGTPGSQPMVLLCCGHGGHGKQHPGYQSMARHLASRGSMVLVPDNIGQGERTPMGHFDALVPFACGTSLQGLILMETLGWVRWLREYGRLDPERIAAIGNSGGGLLTMLLAAFCPELAAICSSGYPSSFEFVARKEKKLCACNILPGLVGEIEMWQLYGCFAPKPLLLFQGEKDRMFPPDLFYRTARKTATAYARSGEIDKFQSAVLAGEHSWDDSSMQLVGDFLAGVFQLAPASASFDPLVHAPLPPEDRCFPVWPKDALTTNDLARAITGKFAADGIHLWEIYPPPCTVNATEEIRARTEARQFLAQLQAFLKSGETPSNLDL